MLIHLMGEVRGQIFQLTQSNRTQIHTQTHREIEAETETEKERKSRVRKLKQFVWVEAMVFGFVITVNNYRKHVNRNYCPDRFSTKVTIHINIYIYMYISPPQNRTWFVCHFRFKCPAMCCSRNRRASTWTRTRTRDRNWDWDWELTLPEIITQLGFLWGL